MKKIIFYFLVVSSSLVFGQKINFEITNSSEELNKIFFTDVSDEVLKTILEKESFFTVNYMGFDEGYYLMKKAGQEVLLYLKPDDDLTIAFDEDDFYNTLTFSGKGADINNYLLSKNLDKVDKRGNLKPFYKRSFYEGGEEEYLEKLDGYYKGQYSSLFNRRFDKTFSDEEMKDLQYGYSLDLLRYQDAKKHYKFKDSLRPSESFLEPLNHIHFQNSELYKNYNSYKELAVLKWKNDITDIKEHPIRDEMISSIRIKPLQQRVLERLMPTMNRANPEHTKSVYNLIKGYTTDNRLLLDAKERYALIRYKDAEKNLAKFKFRDTDGIERSLLDYKGKYLFVYFWMTYCKPCVKNFAILEELKEKYLGENIEFIAIAVEKEENFLRWKGIIEENNAKEPQLFFEEDKLKIIKAYGLASIPDYKIFSIKGLPIDDIDVKKLDKKTEKIIDDLLK